MTISKNVWKIAALLLILCLISAAMISGTFARYTSTFAGEDTALVAKWDIVASGGGIGMAEGGAELDLFSHAYDTHILQSIVDDFIIAPGVDGDFLIEFNNESDVDALVEFEIDDTGADVPVMYSLEPFPTATSYSAVGLAGALDDEFLNIPYGTTDGAIVYWIWPFEGNDEGDTDLGEASAAGASRTEYGLVITATAIQVTPGAI